jgi:hypothetical protein
MESARRNLSCPIHRVNVLFHGEYCGDDLYVPVKALGEQRAQRSVDEAGGQYSFFGGASFPLD